MKGKIHYKPSTLKETIKGTFPHILVLFTLFLFSSAGFLALLYLWDVINAILTANTLEENIKDTFSTFKDKIWIPIIIAPLFNMFQNFWSHQCKPKCRM